MEANHVQIKINLTLLICMINLTLLICVINLTLLI